MIPIREFLLPVCGVGSVLLGLTLTPERLASLGILDASLSSPIEMVRETAALEIVIAKWLLVILGLAMMIGAVFMGRIARSRPYRFIETASGNVPEGYRLLWPKIATPAAAILGAGVAMMALYVAVGDTFFSLPTLVALNREDGGLETLSAILLLVAAAVSARVALGVGDGAYRWMHAFLALLFIAMCGEEISWGQRYLGIETPESLRGLNVQNEINLHNMYGYLFDHLFILFFFMWGSVVPLLNWVSPFARGAFRRIGLPVPSAGLAIGMIAVSLFQEQLTRPLLGALPSLREAEARETLSALAFLLLMLESRIALLGGRWATARHDDAKASGET